MSSTCFCGTSGVQRSFRRPYATPQIPYFSRTVVTRCAQNYRPRQKRKPSSRVRGNWQRARRPVIISRRRCRELVQLFVASSKPRERKPVGFFSDIGQRFIRRTRHFEDGRFGQPVICRPFWPSRKPDLILSPSPPPGFIRLCRRQDLSGNPKFYFGTKKERIAEAKNGIIERRRRTCSATCKRRSRPVWGKTVVASSTCCNFFLVLRRFIILYFMFARYGVSIFLFSFLNTLYTRVSRNGRSGGGGGISRTVELDEHCRRSSVGAFRVSFLVAATKRKCMSLDTDRAAG